MPRQRSLKRVLPPPPHNKTACPLNLNPPTSDLLALWIRPSVRHPTQAIRLHRQFGPLELRQLQMLHHRLWRHTNHVLSLPVLDHLHALQRADDVVLRDATQFTRMIIKTKANLIHPHPSITFHLPFNSPQLLHRLRPTLLHQVEQRVRPVTAIT